MPKISLRAASNSFQEEIRSVSRTGRFKQTRMNLLLLSHLQFHQLPLDFTLQSLASIEELERILRFLPLEEYYFEIKNCNIVEYVVNQLNSLGLCSEECANADLLRYFRRSLLNVAACLSPCAAFSKELIDECLLPMIEEISCLWEMKETSCTVNYLSSLSNFFSHQISKPKVMVQLKLIDFEGKIVPFLTRSTRLKNSNQRGNIRVETQIQLLKFFSVYLERNSCPNDVQSILISYLHTLSKLPSEGIAMLMDLTLEVLFPLNFKQEEAQMLFCFCVKIVSLPSLELIASLTSSHDIPLTLIDEESLESFLDSSKYFQILREDYFRVMSVIIYNLLTTQGNSKRLMEELERSGLDFDELSLPLRLIG